MDLAIYKAAEKKNVSRKEQVSVRLQEVNYVMDSTIERQEHKI